MEEYNYYFCKERGNLRYDVHVAHYTNMTDLEILNMAESIKKIKGWSQCYVYKEPAWNVQYLGTY